LFMGVPLPGALGLIGRVLVIWWRFCLTDEIRLAKLVFPERSRSFSRAFLTDWARLKRDFCQGAVWGQNRFSAMKKASSVSAQGSSASGD
jgi:hypothetical protein